MTKDASLYKTHKAEPLVELHGANKWWNRTLSADHGWETSLSHNGVTFHDPYEPTGFPITYEGKEIRLNTAVAEEACGWFASMYNTDHVKNPTFQKNFFNDWVKLFRTEEEKQITSFAKLDFKPMYEFLLAKSEAKKANNKLPAVRKAKKEAKDIRDSIYGYALVDGYKEKVGNYSVEVPGLFRGRGDHPKTGRIKARIRPEDVILNVGPNETIPEPPQGHQWKGVIHNKSVTWLAFYMDAINSQYKYIYLAASSRFKCENDMKKYEKARTLKKYIKQIRARYLKDMKSERSDVAQRATATYLIDFLALRVGNEKDTTEVADTVGCCNLRVEHLKFLDNCTVHFHFLGKDSMVYDQEVRLSTLAYDNLKRFSQGKTPKTDVFDRLKTAELNKHLSDLMPGLSAKVFRTYNASITLQNTLLGLKEGRVTHTGESVEEKGGMDVDEEPFVDVARDAPVLERVAFYNAANRVVSILCNHQRTVPKGHEGQMAKMEGKIEELREDCAMYKKHLKALKNGSANSNKKAKSSAKPVVDRKGKPLSSSASAVQTKIKALEKKITEGTFKIQQKEEGKSVALNTAKINYMDPRITVAWGKHKWVPIEKLFNKALVSKFPWAMESDSNWRF
jgi:DNA topoisomerase-1